MNRPANNARPPNGPAGRLEFDDEPSISGVRVGLAVVGCGRGGRVNLAAVHDLAELITPVAVVDPDVERAERLRHLYGVDSHYASLDDALEDARITAVAICTPPGDHAEHASQAARAGRHVIVEKPMALSIAECDRIIKAAPDIGQLQAERLQGPVPLLVGETAGPDPLHA